MFYWMALFLVQKMSTFSIASGQNPPLNISAIWLVVEAGVFRNSYPQGSQGEKSVVDRGKVDKNCVVNIYLLIDKHKAICDLL